MKRTSEAAPGSLPGSAPLSTLARFLKVPARPSQRQAVCCVALVVHCRAVLRTESAVKPPGQHVVVLLAWVHVVLAGEVQVGVAFAHRAAQFSYVFRCNGSCSFNRSPIIVAHSMVVGSCLVARNDVITQAMLPFELL